MATMAEQIDEQRKMISDLTARIEGIEQRQAKLACDAVADKPDYQDDEDGDWETLAGLLGFETVYWMAGWLSSANHRAGVPMPGFGDDDQIVRAFKAMLIGLAEYECNGNVWLRRDAFRVNSGNWCWSAGDDDYDSGKETSRPAAAIAMLKAYRNG